MVFSQKKFLFGRLITFLWLQEQSSRHIAHTYIHSTSLWVGKRFKMWQICFISTKWFTGEFNFEGMYYNVLYIKSSISNTFSAFIWGFARLKICNLTQNLNSGSPTKNWNMTIFEPLLPTMYLLLHSSTHTLLLQLSISWSILEPLDLKFWWRFNLRNNLTFEQWLYELLGLLQNVLVDHKHLPYKLAAALLTKS